MKLVQNPFSPGSCVNTLPFLCIPEWIRCLFSFAFPHEEMYFCLQLTWVPFRIYAGLFHSRNSFSMHASKDAWFWCWKINENCSLALGLLLKWLRSRISHSSAMLRDKWHHEMLCMFTQQAHGMWPCLGELLPGFSHADLALERDFSFPTCAFDRRQWQSLPFSAVHTLQNIWVTTSCSIICHLAKLHRWHFPF